MSKGEMDKVIRMKEGKLKVYIFFKVWGSFGGN
jgi:hypothetical protein